ncbi:MAG TPA: PAS domain-containing protein [Sideroxyarcus sp.]|nr:PAS domain-containing protein [Sideroxyarcus sp.]
MTLMDTGMPIKSSTQRMAGRQLSIANNANHLRDHVADGDANQSTNWVKYTPADQIEGYFHILLLGNEPSGQAARITLLAHLDFEMDFIEARSAKAALLALNHRAIDLIVYGDGVSDMDGLEFLCQLNKKNQARKVPVIEILNRDTANAGIKAMKMGAHDYLLKDPDGGHLEILPILVSRIYAEKNIFNALHKMAGVHQTIASKIPSVIYQVSLQDGHHDLCISQPVLEMGITPERWGCDAELHHCMCHEEDRERVRSTLAHSMQTGSMFECEYRINALGNGIRWFYDRANIIMDKCGRPLQVQGVMTDITNSKVLEFELLQYRNMLERMVTQRTDQLLKRTSILESCNSNLGAKLHALQQKYSDLKARFNIDENWQPGSA